MIKVIEFIPYKRGYYVKVNGEFNPALKDSTLKQALWNTIREWRNNWL
nr:MAG TPA: hypothetical protein [Caudoviricetes sp.]